MLFPGTYSDGEEEAELLSHEEKRHTQLTDVASHSSEMSEQSGIHFYVTDHPQVHFSHEEKM